MARQETSRSATRRGDRGGETTQAEHKPRWPRSHQQRGEPAGWWTVASDRPGSASPAAAVDIDHSTCEACRRSPANRPFPPLPRSPDRLCRSCDASPDRSGPTREESPERIKNDSGARALPRRWGRTGGEHRRGDTDVATRTRQHRGRRSVSAVTERGSMDHCGVVFPTPASCSATTRGTVLQGG